MVARALGPVFMFCAPGLVFGGIEGVRTRFHVLQSRTRFRRYRGRRDPFSCFARPDSLSAVPRASDPVFMFCAHELIFGRTEGVGSRFHVLRARTNFRRYRGRRVPLSCFALSESFSTVPSASDPVFLFCAPELIIGGSEGVRSRFHVLRTRTRFRWYRGRRIPFSCFALPESFSAVLWDSGPVFMFCVLRLIFGCNEGVLSLFHVLRSRNYFRRYRGRRVPLSCFALPESFSAEPSASGHTFMFCAPGLIIGDSKGVVSRFHVLRACTYFRR
jgi:hypothetical protein